jgi:hypothetical protein
MSRPDEDLIGCIVYIVHMVIIIALFYILPRREYKYIPDEHQNEPSYKFTISNNSHKTIVFGSNDIIVPSKKQHTQATQSCTSANTELSEYFISANGWG